jgi:hypothetical protein
LSKNVGRKKAQKTQWLFFLFPFVPLWPKLEMLSFSKISLNFLSGVIIYNVENGRVQEKRVDAESFS